MSDGVYDVASLLGARPLVLGLDPTSELVALWKNVMVYSFGPLGLARLYVTIMSSGREQTPIIVCTILSGQSAMVTYLIL